MSQQHAAELCTIIVNDIYGEVSSKVVSILLQLGRLPIPQICHHIKLNPKIVKQTLVVLIQQHLVTHYTHVENHRDVVYYECEWMQVYELLHAGHIIRATETRFGADGALIVSNMLQLGHAKVSDFITAYGTSKAKRGGGGGGGGVDPSTNGGAVDPSKVKREGDSAPFDETDGSHISSVDTLKAVMADMLQARFLIPVQDYHMHPRTDILNTMRTQLTAQLRSTGGFTVETKLVKEVEKQMVVKLAGMVDGDTTGHGGMKRKAAPTMKGRAKKKQKVSVYDEGPEEEEEEWEIDEEVVLRVNHEKFLVLFRNQELVSLAEKRLGKTTAAVYSQFLARIEPKYLRCRTTSDDDDDTKKRIKLSVLELSKTFDPTIELENTIVLPPKELTTKDRKRARSSSPVPTNGKRTSSPTLFSSEEDEWSHDDDDSPDADPDATRKKKRMSMIKQHLELLAEDSFKFLRTESTRGMGEWSVNYKELGKLMKQIEVEKVVEERFGRMGTRLLRIIKEKGRIDEKQIATIALLKQKEIRATLSGLHEAGHLALQEVPKTATPQVSRMFFLWFYDADRAAAALVADMYKAMSRCLQRTDAERGKRRSLLDKAERSDVAANMEEYLTKGEKRELEIWGVREEKLWAAVLRLDRMVLIMRDF